MLKGEVSVFDLTDSETGLILRVARYDLPLVLKVISYQTLGNKQAQERVDAFTWDVMGKMDLDQVRDNGETPFYFWVRAMKVRNRLSFEDGIYSIPDTLASSIVRSDEARAFLDLIGGVAL